MMPVLFGLAGAILGATFGPLSAAVLGFVLGLVWKKLADIGAEHDALKREQAETRARQQTIEIAVRDLHRRAETEGPGAAASPPAPAIREAQPPAQPVSRPAAPPPPPLLQRPPVLPRERPLERPAAAAVSSRWLVEFFTTGNIVAKVGIVIVFFGVAFLVRYAADRGLLPIEYRLMGAVAGALALLAVGWRLRRSRPEYAVVLQGGSVGLLYLTIFAAFRLYDLLPASLTFALLLVVVAFSAALAVLQNAMSLAVLGTSGGFLAPILASAGGGSHVALFTYYAVLNAGVLGIAWFRAWRFLNWLAFVFTFGIGFTWGQQDYRPELLATTEPFLVGFFLLFVTVSVMFAHRQPPELRGYVDGSLVFGTPAVAFGMQSVLMRDVAFGRAFSAVAVAALYLSLASWLWRRDHALRPLAEAFLALATVFLILAVPLAFDGHATAAAWALEGTGLVWIGIRQQRRLARLAGSALSIGSGVAFAVMASPPAGTLPILSARFLGGIAIAIGSLIAARLLSKARSGLTRPERGLEGVLVAWGTLWWFGASLMEIERHVPARVELAGLLIVSAANVGLAGLIARALNWRALMLAAIPIGPLLWSLAVAAFAFTANEGPLADLGWLAWPLVVGVSYLLVYWFETGWPAAVVRGWHAGTTWLLLFLATWAAAVGVDGLVPEAPTWAAAVWCITPALVALALVRRVLAPAWPVRRFEDFYAGPIAAFPTAAALIWAGWACTERGSAAPLPYVPLLNPIELAQGLAFVAPEAWARRFRRRGERHEKAGRLLRPLVAAMAFLALNAAVARVVHFYMGVPFNPDDLMESFVFQAGISILWGITAGVLMTVARRRLDRTVWVVGAGLLGVLILKLFVVDLGNVGGIARIVSFLVTGVVILLIGYFAPAPPRSEKTA
jgi:uncharacterized membrane protein